MDKDRFKKVFRLRQLDTQLTDIETQMKKIASHLASTSDILEMEKDKAAAMTKE